MGTKRKDDMLRPGDMIFEHEVCEWYFIVDIKENHVVSGSKNSRSYDVTALSDQGYRTYYWSDISVRHIRTLPSTVIRARRQR